MDIVGGNSSIGYVVLNAGKVATAVGISLGGTVSSGFDGNFKVTMNGKLTAKGATLTDNTTVEGKITSTGGNFKSVMDQGRFEGYYGASDRVGYMDFTSYNSNNGYYGTRIGGKGCLVFLTRSLGVHTYAAPSTSVTYTEGQDGTIKIPYNFRYSGNNLTWDDMYVYFTKGLMTTRVTMS